MFVINVIEIDKIIPYINNPRKNLNIDKVASSIKEFGFQQPIVIDKENIIIVGHTRFEAAKKLGLDRSRRFKKNRPIRLIRVIGKMVSPG